MESIKAWHIMKAGIRQTIKVHLPYLSEQEIDRLLDEIEKECSGLSPEDIAGCVYRKIEEVRRGKAGRV
jgi:hypothetical protein